MPVALPSIEPRSAARRFVDRRGFGIHFDILTHGPNAGRPMCVAAGRAARLSDFFSITDLPVGSLIVAVDRAESLWAYSKTGVWIPQSEYTGTFPLGASRALDASDNRAILFNTSAKTITVPAGLPAGFEVRAVQAGPGAMSFNFAAVTVATVKTKTNGGGAMARLVHLGDNTYTLTGDANA